MIFYFHNMKHNLNNTILKARIANRQNRISEDAMRRAFRRLKAPVVQTELNWEAMMALRANIEKEIKPVLSAQHEAQYVAYDIAYEVNKPVKRIRKKVSVPFLKNADCTPDWWKEAGKRERRTGKMVLA
jgi:hypothetical protein